MKIINLLTSRELQLQLSVALPFTLADAMCIIIIKIIWAINIFLFLRPFSFFNFVKVTFLSSPTYMIS